MSNLNLLPYTTLNGEPTLSDQQLQAIYLKMKQDGTAARVFFQGDVRNESDFVSAMKSGANLLFLTMNETTPVAVCWLNRFEGRMARLHFCTFRDVWGTDLCDEIARYTSETLINLKGLDGGYLWDVFLGYLPSSNRLAIRYLLQNRYTLVGRVPNLMWDHKNQRSVEGTIFCYTRGSR